MKTIEITEEQWEALQNGEPITIHPKSTQWEPRGGTYRITGEGEIEVYNSHMDEDHGRDFGMRYESKHQAMRARDMMRAHHRLVAYAMEHWPDYTPPPAGKGMAYFLHYNAKSGEWAVCAYIIERCPWVPYGPRSAVHELVEKLNSGEVVL